jgi:hypothetical protein
MGTVQSLCATGGGAYLLCSSYPSGFTLTTSQQVEYRIRDNAGSYAWDDQKSPVYNGVYPGTNNPAPTINPTTDVVAFSNMYQGYPGSSLGWLVRYRNVYPSDGCNTISGLPNQLWTPGTYNTEYWLY